jgi:hypothetical protein
VPRPGMGRLQKCQALLCCRAVLCDPSLAAIACYKGDASYSERLGSASTACITRSEIIGSDAEGTSASYAANIVALPIEAGYRPTERLIRVDEALTRAMGFELLAALGPTCWLAFIDVLALGARHASKTPRWKEPAKAQSELARVPASVEPNVTADVVDRWIAGDLEGAPAASMRTTELRQLWEPWCRARGIRSSAARERPVDEAARALQARHQQQPASIPGRPGKAQSPWTPFGRQQLACPAPPW